MSKIKEKIGEFINKIKNFEMFGEREESQDMPEAELAVEVSKKTGQDINEINKAFAEANKTVGGLTERMQKSKQRNNTTIRLTSRNGNTCSNSGKSTTNRSRTKNRKR